LQRRKAGSLLQCLLQIVISQQFSVDS